MPTRFRLKDMRRKTWLPSVLIPALLFAGAAPGEALARRPPKSTGTAVLETLGGAAGGALLGLAGGLLVASQMKSKSCEDLQCADFRGFEIFLGMMAGYAVGNPAGIVLTGKALDPHGSTAGAAVGGFLGQLVVLPLAFSTGDARLALPALILLPAAAGTFGYYLDADPPEEAETARRMREARAMEALARARLPAEGSPVGRFRADLLTFRF